MAAPARPNAIVGIVALRRVVAALALALLLGSGAALADQNDKRLDPLFAQLKTASSVEEAQPVEEQIWNIWLQSGNDAVDEVMRSGVQQLNAGDLQPAVEAFSRVIEMAPDFAEGWNKRATALYLSGRFAESIHDVDRVLALEPRHFGALSGLGLCNAQLAREEAALDAFQRAIDVNPNMPGVIRSIEALKLSLQRHAI